MAIDIPLSPRPYPHVRRSSSVAQQHRALLDDDDVDVHRSISLGANDREPPPSMSALLRAAALEGEGAGSPVLGPPDAIQPDSPRDVLRQGPSSVDRDTRLPSGLFSDPPGSPYGRRYGSSVGRGASTPHSGSGSSTAPGGRYGRGFRGGTAAAGLGVVNSPADEPEDEPLLFELSEIGREMNRRSLEDARGGGSVGSNSERGGYESGRGSRRW